MKRLTFLSMTLILATSNPQSANAFESCRAYTFSKAEASDYSAATIKGPSESKVYFFNPGKTCQEPLCQKNTFLTPEERILTSIRQDGWVCVHYSPGNQEFYGWVREDQIEFNTRRPISTRADWIGTWVVTSEDVNTGQIRISAGNRTNALSFNGVAIWPPTSEAPATGMFEGTGTIKNNQVIVNDKPCKVRLVWVGGEIVASDNDKCGGFNVFFNGVYHKQTVMQ